MTNLVCTSRSNYFRVKDEAAFLAWANDTGMVLTKDHQGRYALLGDGEGNWPGYRYTGEDRAEGLRASLAGPWPCTATAAR